jgi:hypothetical protein
VNAQLRKNKVSCNCHLSVEWDSVEFGAENSKRLVDDLNRKCTKFTGEGSLPRALESEGVVQLFTMQRTHVRRVQPVDERMSAHERKDCHGKRNCSRRVATRTRIKSRIESVLRYYTIEVGDMG